MCARQSRRAPTSSPLRLFASSPLSIWLHSDNERPPTVFLYLAERALVAHSESIAGPREHHATTRTGFSGRLEVKLEAERT